MKLKEKTIDELTVLEIEGNIFGGREAGPLSERFAELLKAGKYKVVLDLTKVNWINIAGLGLLMGGFTAVRNHKGDVKLAYATERIRTLLESANFPDIFDCHQNVETAVESFKAENDI